MNQSGNSKLDLIRNAVCSVEASKVRQSKGSAYPSHVIPTDKAKPKQLDNALAAMAPGRPRTETAVLVDTTFMGSGKDGCLFMEDGIYMGPGFCVPKKGAVHPIPLVYRYEEILEAATNAGAIQSPGDVNHWLITKNPEGKFNGRYVGPCAWFLALAINATLRSLRQANLIPQKPGTVSPSAARQTAPSATATLSASTPAQDPQKALNILLASAKRGNTEDAQKAIQILREQGTVQSLEEALRLACRIGSSELTGTIEQELLQMHRTALGAQNWKQAVFLCRIGRDLKLPDSAYAYAQMAEAGHIKEYSAAVECYEDAAKYGSREAALRVIELSIKTASSKIGPDAPSIPPQANISNEFYRFEKWTGIVANRTPDGPDIVLNHIKQLRDRYFNPDSTGYKKMDKAFTAIELARKDWNTYGAPDLSAEAVKRFREYEEQLKKSSQDVKTTMNLAGCYRTGIGTCRSRKYAVDYYQRAGFLGVAEGAYIAAQLLIEEEQWSEAAICASRALLTDYEPAWELLDLCNAHLPEEKQYDLPWRPGWLQDHPVSDDDFEEKDSPDLREAEASNEQPVSEDRRLMFQQAQLAIQANDHDKVIATVTPLVTTGEDKLRKSTLLRRLLATAHAAREEFDLAERFASEAAAEKDPDAEKLLDKIHKAHALQLFRDADVLARKAESFADVDQAMLMLYRARKSGFHDIESADALYKILSDKRNALQSEEIQNHYLGYTFFRDAALHKLKDNHSKALASYELAASNGCAPAAGAAAAMYLSGTHTEQDTYRAFCLYKQAAEQGSVDAYPMLASLYAEAPDPRIPWDMELAQHWAELGLACNAKKAEKTFKNLPAFCLNKGISLFEEFRWKDAVPCLEWAANAGNGDAAFELARLYHNSSDSMEKDYKPDSKEQNEPIAATVPEQKITPDQDTFVHWLKRAAELKHITALELAADYSLTGGCGFTRSLRNALFWTEQAVDAEAYTSHNLLYLIASNQETDVWKKQEFEERSRLLKSKYLFYLGVDKEREKSYSDAEVYFAHAAEYGSSTAAYNLGIFYYNDFLTVKINGHPDNEFSRKAYFTWFLRAAQLGNSDSMHIVAEEFAKGLTPIPADLDQALSWNAKYNEAQKNDPETGVSELHELYRKHKALRYIKLGQVEYKRKNLSLAESCFRLAAQTGDPYGMWQFADFLAKEFPHRPEIEKYYSLAAEQGLALAQFSPIFHYHDGSYIIQKTLSYDLIKHWAAQLRANPDANSEMIEYLDEKKL